MGVKLKIPARQVLPSHGDVYLRCGSCGSKEFRAQVLPLRMTARLRYLVCAGCGGVGEVDDVAMVGVARVIRPETLQLRCDPCGGNRMKVHVRPVEPDCTAKFLQCADVLCSNVWEIGPDAQLGGTGKPRIKVSAS